MPRLDGQPLAETLAVIRGEGDAIALFAGRPHGERWVRLDDALGDDDVLRRWLSATRAGAESSDKVAMMFLASWLSGTARRTVGDVAGPVAAGLDRRSERPVRPPD